MYNEVINKTVVSKEIHDTVCKTSNEMLGFALIHNALWKQARQWSQIIDENSWRSWAHATLAHNYKQGCCTFALQCNMHPCINAEVITALGTFSGRISISSSSISFFMSRTSKSTNYFNIAI